jgi:hypothetical protein
MLNYVAEMLCFCQHPMKWTATGETMTGDGSGLISREGIKEAQDDDTTRSTPRPAVQRQNKERLLV